MGHQLPQKRITRSNRRISTQPIISCHLISWCLNISMDQLHIPKGTHAERAGSPPLCSARARQWRRSRLW